MDRRTDCIACRRPLDGADSGCARCGRPPLTPEILLEATVRAGAFARAHERDPWLRSAGLLSYSLRSRRRGFLDDPARPFTRAALELLWELAVLGGASGVSPLVETAIADAIEDDHPVIARALGQLLEQHRGALRDPGPAFADWYAAL